LDVRVENEVTPKTRPVLWGRTLLRVR